MLPLRPFLSPKVRFEWTEVLKKAFEGGKQGIVQIFDLNLETCIRTDWSTTGMGYYQKACGCSTVDLNCCQGGWRICLAGSLFNLDA